uniref:hypothetical protein n=1 Tax=Agathobacter sp. TaxID=2021311 RepID=UPI00405708DA
MSEREMLLIILSVLSIIGILLIFLLLKTNRIKKQIDTIRKDVEKYVTFIMEETEEEKTVSQYASLDMNTSRLKNDEEKHELIQHVLKEIFP